MLRPLEGRPYLDQWKERIYGEQLAESIRKVGKARAAKVKLKPCKKGRKKAKK